MKGFFLFYSVSSFVFVLRHHHDSYVHEIHGKHKNKCLLNICLMLPLDVWRLAFGIGRVALALDIYILFLAMDGNGLGIGHGRLAQVKGAKKTK